MTTMLDRLTAYLDEKQKDAPDDRPVWTDDPLTVGDLRTIVSNLAAEEREHDEARAALATERQRADEAEAGAAVLRRALADLHVNLDGRENGLSGMACLSGALTIATALDSTHAGAALLAEVDRLRGVERDRANWDNACQTLWAELSDAHRERDGALASVQALMATLRDILASAHSADDVRLLVAGMGGTVERAPETHERLDRYAAAHERAWLLLRTPEPPPAAPDKAATFVVCEACGGEGRTTGEAPGGFCDTCRANYCEHGGDDPCPDCGPAHDPRCGPGVRALDVVEPEPLDVEPCPEHGFAGCECPAQPACLSCGDVRLTNVGEACPACAGDPAPPCPGGDAGDGEKT